MSIASRFFKTNMFVGFSYLSLFQMINIGFPILIYPYLIKTIGLNNYGWFVFINAISLYFVIFINQGFDLTAVKVIGENRSNIKRTNMILSSVLYVKFILFFISFCVFSFVFVFINSKHSYLVAVVIFFQLIIYNMTPFWFYQAIEKIKIISIINALVKVVSLLFVFVFVNEQNDLINYVSILLIVNIVGFLSSIVLIYKVGYKLILVSIDEIKDVILKSVPYFFSRIATAITEYTSSIMIGLFVGLDSLAIYDIANKVITVFKTPFQIFSQVFYPVSLRCKNIKYNRVALFVLTGLSVLICLGILFFSKNIYAFFNLSSYNEFMLVINILVLYIPFNVITLVLGASTLIVFNKEREYNKSVYFGVAFYILVLCMYLLGFVDINAITFFCLLYVLPEVITAVARFIYSVDLLLGRKNVFSKR
ncbi:oligosaccharide flippase family protein [Photobacterium piscicola]|uniref:oligosaccharide flippase family protein n=1 Tax=Photobacterium piscicola TaxID=1378299 RepID=UPI0038CFAB24